MRIVTWAIRLILFILLLAFAAKNTDPVTLRFYFDLAWQAPLVALLLAFFVAGAIVGVAAALTTLLRQRRELHRLRRETERRSEGAEPAVPTPPSPAEG
ncbi:MAG: lipopolysaccharide assembly protein LapA domain-containing protein [Burkholderiales bacterium]